MNIDRRALMASLGGAAAVSLMGSEARADALEHYLSERLDAEVEDQEAAADKPATAQPAAATFPTVADLEAQIENRGWRRGAGGLFVPGIRSESGRVKRLAPMPAKPTLLDFFKYRFAPANHVLQSATRARQTGMPEEIIFACLMHDVVQEMIKPDHGWWGAQLLEPYVSKKVTFAIRYHQALRFYADPSVGYEYPELYKRIWGSDYVPPPYIEATYKYVRNHKWYMEPRLVTVNDLYAFDPNAKVSIDPFIDIMGRQFKQPKEGLGYDTSPVAHMWRTIERPDSPL
jgi:hypothetical protein